jgi:hypothetical protein
VCVCIYIRSLSLSLTHTQHTGSAQGFLRVLITEEKPPAPAGIQFTCFASTNVQILTPEKHRASSSSSSSWFLLLRLLYICPHTTTCVSSYYSVCPHTTTCVLILLCVSSYYNICVLMLQQLLSLYIYVSSYYSVFMCPHNCMRTVLC